MASSASSPPIGLAMRLLLLVVALLAALLAWQQPGLVVTRLLATLAAAGAAGALWHHLRHTDRELARFVEALRHGDFSQGFAGAGATALGQALDGAMRDLRAERAGSSEAARVQGALADEAPAALLTIDDAGRVTLANKAARRLFRTLRGTRIEDFARFGPRLVEALAGTGAPGVLPLRIDGVVQRAMVTRAEQRGGGRPLTILSIQPIQAELSAVELAAQADLVRVLTHEIMNSMTPVVSLADSAARLMAGVDRGDDPDVADARLAIEALARRSSGIMHFVETYRAFSHAPVVEPRRFAVRPWLEELARLFAASPQGERTPLSIAIEPDDLRLDADPDLLAQVILNLLKNGAEAGSAATDTPRLAITVGLLPAGRTRIAVADNGPGIAPAMAEEIFLPFFTTKGDGTGVGLSLARRIMAAHGGTIALAPGGDGGATFELTV